MQKKAKPHPETPPSHEAIVNQVFGWIVEGKTEFDIEQSIAASFPGEQPKPLIAEVMVSLRKSGEFDAEVVIGWAFESCRHLYRKMVETGDFAGALRAVKSIAGLAKAKYVHDGDEPETTPPETRPPAGTGDQVLPAEAPP